MNAGTLLGYPNLVIITATGLLLSSGCGVDSEADQAKQDLVMVSAMVDIPQEVLRASGRGYQAFANGVPTLLYLNFDGATIIKGPKSDSSSNTSFIGGGTVPPFSGSQAERQSVITLIKQLYARYKIQIVTTRPSSGDYDMAMIGGSPADINLNAPPNVAGVAPMDCDNRLPRDISFIFAGSIKAIYGSSSKFAQRVAETGAHEVGHVYGLPHSGVGCDLMSYSPCAALKTFLDQSMPMQSDSYGRCGMTQMNSHQLLLSTLGPASGPAPDTTAPAVTITAPQSGATVSATVTVKANITDDTGVTTGELLVDGKVVASRNSAPFDYSVSLDSGSHTLEVVGRDAAGNAGQASVSVTMGSTTPPPGEDTVSPVVTITSPAAGAVVGAQATVQATVTDDTGVTRVELRADGALIQSLTAAPYSFSLNLTAGAHQLQVRAQDAAGNTGSASVAVTVDASKPSTPLPGPTTPPAAGSFGADCTRSSDCLSQICAEDPQSGGRYCTQTCADNGACPAEAGCFPTDSAGVSVCGPPQPNSSALQTDPTLLGSCAVGTGGQARVGLTPALLLLLLLLHLRRRRR